MKRLVTTIAFFMVLVLIAIGVYGVWIWVFQPLGFAFHLSQRQTEVLNRIIFCGYFGLFAVLCAGYSIAFWIDRKMGAFFVSLLATAGSVGLGVDFYLHAGQMGAGVLAFGLPMFLAIVAYILRPFKRWN